MSWNRFGHPSAILFEAWGGPGCSFWVPRDSHLAPRGSLWAPRGVTFGTPGVTMGPRGIILEPQGYQNSIGLMSVKRWGTFLELPGLIWGGCWGYFEVLLGSFFSIFSRCVFEGVFGRFGHRFGSQNGCKFYIFLRKSGALAAKVGPSILNNPLMKIMVFQVLGHTKNMKNESESEAKIKP